MEKKGQGALEYLLLIGGAIVVAVVVVTLLLNLGSAGGGATSATAMGALASQFAATSGSNNCVDLNPTGSNTAYIFSSGTSECFKADGTYPSCSASKQVATTSLMCCKTPGTGLGNCTEGTTTDEKNFRKI